MPALMTLDCSRRMLPCAWTSLLLRLLCQTLLQNYLHKHQAADFMEGQGASRPVTVYQDRHKAIAKMDTCAERSAMPACHMCDGKE